MKFEYNKRYISICLYTIVTFTICAILYRTIMNWKVSNNIFSSLTTILSPIIMSIVVAYFLSPMVNFFEQHIFMKLHIKTFRLKSASFIRVLSILFSYFIVLGTIVILLAVIIPQLITSITDISLRSTDYVKLAMDYFDKAYLQIGTTDYYLDFTILSQYLSENLPKTIEQISSMVSSFAPSLVTLLKNFASGLLNIVFGFVIAVYLLYSKEKFLASSRKSILAIFQPRSAVALLNTFKESHRIFSSFFIGKIIDSLIIGLMCFIILLIAKIPYALLLSVIVGITNVIPYFGPFIGGIVGFIFLLLATPVKALWFALIILGLQQFDGNILGPKILGDSTGLSPFWVIFAILLFGGAFGFVGMFIGVPCFAVIKNIIDHQIDKKYEQRMTDDDDPFL